MLIQGFPADPKVAGDGGLLFAVCNSPLQFGYLVVGQRFLPSPIGTALLGNGNAFALPFADESTFELGKGPHDNRARSKAADEMIGMRFPGNSLRSCRLGFAWATAEPTIHARGTCANERALHHCRAKLVG